MDELMQVLFNDILERLLAKYYGRTDYEECCTARDDICSKLCEQLTPAQRAQLKELQQAYDYVHMAELEAMFMASFDLCKSLAFPHSA